MVGVELVLIWSQILLTWGLGSSAAAASVQVIFSSSPPPVWPGGAPVGCSTKSLVGHYYP